MAAPFGVFKTPPKETPERKVELLEIEIEGLHKSLAFASDDEEIDDIVETICMLKDMIDEIQD